MTREKGDGKAKCCVHSRADGSSGSDMNMHRGVQRYKPTWEPNIQKAHGTHRLSVKRSWSSGRWLVSSMRRSQELCMSQALQTAWEANPCQSRGTGQGNDGDLISDKYLQPVQAVSGAGSGAGQDGTFGKGSAGTSSPRGLKPILWGEGTTTVQDSCCRVKHHVELQGSLRGPEKVQHGAAEVQKTPAGTTHLLITASSPLL